MAAKFSKETSLMLFGCFRQAERSVHYALSSPQQWPQFMAYYDASRRARLADLIAILKAAGANLDHVPGRRALAQNSLIEIVRAATGLVVNRFRVHWSFSVEELAFFLATLERLLSALHSPGPPEKQRLLDLRFDCLECQAIVRRRLRGIPELQIAAQTEHFNQSEYVDRLTSQDTDTNQSGEHRRRDAV